MTIPLIGITGRRKTGDQLKDSPAILGELDGYWFYANYARAIIEAGGIPVALCPDAQASHYLDRLDGILLSGGTDIEPERYGASSETDAFAPEPDRDEFELDLLNAAAEYEKPMLGICRGLQMLNVFAGGTLNQDVPSHAAFDKPPSTPFHPVTIEPGSVLGGLYGPSIEVNSLHHQTVDKVGADLMVSGRHGPDVEGLEHCTLPMVAVQWHPEMMPTRPTDPIFGWLVAEATNRLNRGS